MKKFIERDLSPFMSESRSKCSRDKDVAYLHYMYAKTRRDKIINDNMRVLVS